MSNEAYNPILGVSIEGGGAASPIPVPSKFQWEMQDLSKKGAGRTEDNKMHKKRSGQLIKLTVQWNSVKGEDAKTILRAFNPEYVDVTYLSPFDNGYITETFYVGDRRAPLFNSKRRVWNNIGFSLTSRNAEVKGA